MKNINEFIDYINYQEYEIIDSWNREYPIREKHYVIFKNNKYFSLTFTSRYILLYQIKNDIEIFICKRETFKEIIKEIDLCD